MTAYIIIGVIIVVAIIIFIAVKSGTSTASGMIRGYSQLKIGMTKAEVIGLFGSPTGIRNAGDIETLTWKHSEFKGFVRGGTMVRTVVADFKNDILVGFDSENMDRSAW